MKTNEREGAKEQDDDSRQGRGCVRHFLGIRSQFALCISEECAHPILAQACSPHAANVLEDQEDQREASVHVSPWKRDSRKEKNYRAEENLREHNRRHDESNDATLRQFCAKVGVVHEGSDQREAQKVCNFLRDRE